MKKDESLFDVAFLERFSTRRIFLPLCVTFLGGVLVGAAGGSWRESFGVYSDLPLHFSGVPTPTAGFFSCFSSILLNGLISLIVLFLLGVTVFGSVGVPVFLFFKGITVGIGALSFLGDSSALSWARSALEYLPGAAAIALLLLLFGTRALIFSKSLAKAGFSASGESLDFYFYFKDFLAFLCFSVAVSLGGSVLAMLGIYLRG